jgi:mono/diheme cytochrome c family protein
MRRVSSGLCVGIALAYVVVASSALAAQAGPSAVPPEAKKLKSPVASSPTSIEAGGQLYQKYCRFCHGATGKGDSPMAPKTMQPSNLTDAQWTRGSSEGEIFWVISNGAPPKYDMKGVKGKVSDPDIWNLVHYVRSLGGVAKSH